jgi:hypothetical protein
LLRRPTIKKHPASSPLRHNIFIYLFGSPPQLKTPQQPANIAPPSLPFYSVTVAAPAYHRKISGIISSIRHDVYSFVLDKIAAAFVVDNT